MHWQNKNKKATPPLLSLRRAKSARELYRPAVTDLSEQAAWSTNCQDLEEDTFIHPLGISNIYLNREDPTKSITENGYGLENSSHYERSNTHICLNTKMQSNSEETCKRLPYSAANRLRLLSTFKRPRSVDSYVPSPRSIPYPDNSYRYQSLVITNASSPQYSSRFGNTDNYNERKSTHTHRPLIRTVTHGSLLSDGFTGQKNGFHEYLMTTHPQVKQKISSWMTNGFKVQSINLRNNKSTGLSKTSSSGRLRKAPIDRKINYDICTTSICIQGNSKGVENIRSESFKPSQTQNAKYME